jgi:hypothetical protein
MSAAKKIADSFFPPSMTPFPTPPANLSRRDYFAGMAMIALVYDASLRKKEKKTWGAIVADSREFADEMIAELDRTNPQSPTDPVCHCSGLESNVAKHDCQRNPVPLQQ